MATKDAHIALIDAHEKLEQVKGMVRDAIRLAERKRAGGPLTEDDRLMIKAIRAQAIDQVKRIQDELAEELK